MTKPAKVVLFVLVFLALLMFGVYDTWFGPPTPETTATEHVPTVSRHMTDAELMKEYNLSAEEVAVARVWAAESVAADRAYAETEELRQQCATAKRHGVRTERMGRYYENCPKP